jgi:methionine synthase II (cobalamin-independent)
VNHAQPTDDLGAGVGPRIGSGIGTGIGSLPGESMPESLRLVRDTLPDLPHLPELPGRGPGADLVGRGAALLVELPTDLQPHGWRLVDHPGRDARRAASFLRADVDDLAEAFDGYAGLVKVQLTGPWTLAASLWLARGERALTDPGARRDLVSSLAAGVGEHVAAVRAAVPGAELVVQLDEPSLPAVLAGHLPTASQLGVVRALDVVEAEQGLAEVIAAVHAAGAASVVHSCAADVPVGLLQRAGAGAISLDLSLATTATWEELGAAVEGGVRLWAGAVPTAPAPVSADRPDGLPGDLAVVEAIRRPWRGLGLPQSGLAGVVVTPTCGLARSSPAYAALALARVVSAARALGDAAED